ncbi:Hypothetical predicted protein [Octopus vulgaris]|uniref:Tetratricopeptide repeat protein n=1 Tax=Octopus vulgaris TaxID=6645 RepID=A0AA36FDW5_OCTVU|nr:Hypothetical predicted protein [Octopus vulgaris]
MSEDELRRLVNIPSAKWSPVYLSLVGSLVNRNGIYNFFHDYLRQAVEAEELPFLLYEAGEMESLKETLSDLNLFQQLMATEQGKYDLIHYWKLFDDFNEVSKVYKEQLEYFNGNRQSEDFLKLSKSLAQLFIDLSLLDDAKYNLGTVYFASNHFARAKYQWQEAVKVFECLLGVEHCNTIAAADAVREVTVLVNSN